MSKLTDIVSHVCAEAQDEFGSIDVHRGVKIGLPMVKEDAEAVDQCISEALAKRMKDAATRVRKVANDAPDRSLSFINMFDLRPRHALDDEGRILKATHALSRLEVGRIIQIRRDQISADAAYLDRLEKAVVALAPIWDANPQLTFGEAEELFNAARGAAQSGILRA